MNETRLLALEVAYRVPGKNWVRKIVKTETAFDKLLAKLEGQSAEVRVRDAEERN